jgi:CRISPR-associated endonuclease/helicase Cas3
LIVIEDLTGSGKTEAALILAARLMASGQAERLYVGLPTQATSNAMFGRLGALYRRLFHEDTRPTIALAHGGAWLHEGFREAILAGGQGEDDRQGSSEGEEPASRLANAWLADNRKKALLADLGVGTLDQALLGAMGTRHQALRLFGPVGSVLVVDEVHAYDTYTHRLLVALLTFQAALGGSAILLSATLPIARRRDLLATYAGLRREALSRQSLEKASAYPLLTLAGVGEDPIQCPVEIPPGSGRSFPRCHRLEDEEAAVAVLVEAADRGDCAVWIRNTVQDARASFDLLADRLPPERLSLFHARFLPADRARLEEAVLASFGKTSSSDVRRGRILVATRWWNSPWTWISTSWCPILRPWT